MPDNQVKVVIAGENDAGGAFSQVDEQLEHLASAGERVADVLETVGAAEVLAKLGELAAGALEAGANLAEMSERTGVSAEELAGLQYAAQQSGVSTDNFEKGIRKLQATLTSAAQGNAKAAAALKAVGVSARDSSGGLTSASSALDTIADKFSRTADGTAKAGLAVQIFGRSGTEMIPMLNKGSEGLDAMRQRAEELGLILSEDEVDAIKQLRDNLAEMHAESVALAEHFMAGLAPAIDDIDKAMTQGAGSAGEFAHELGDDVGSAIKVVVAGVMAMGFAWDWATIKIADYVDAAMSVMNLDFSGAATKIEAMFGLIGDRRIHDLETNFKNMWNSLYPDQATVAKHTRTVTDSLDVVDAAAKDHSRELLAFQVAQIKAGEAASKAAVENEQSENETLYKHNLKTVEEYYADKKQLAADSITVEMYALEQEGKLYDAALAKLPATNKNENERLSIMTKQVEIATQLDTLQKKLYASQGQTPNGSADPLAQLAESEDIATAKAKLLGDTIESTFQRVKDQIDQVKARVDDFQETSFQGQKDTNQILQQSGQSLQQLISDYAKLAQASGDPRLVTNAQKFQTQLDAMTLKAHTFLQTLGQEGTQDLSNFFAQILEGAPRGENVFAAFGKSVEATLAQMIAKMWAAYLMQKLIGFASGFAGGGGGGFQPSGITSAWASAGSGPIGVVPHAIGGSAMPGQALEVGELGPELFVPGEAGTVIPNSQLGSSVGQGAGMHQQINVDLRGADISAEQRLNARMDKLADITLGKSIVAQREMKLRRV